MTRKDYIAIAEALRQQLEDYALEPLAHQRIVIDAACRLARIINLANPRLDRGYFMAIVRGERGIRSRPKRKLHCVGCGSNDHCLSQCEGTSRPKRAYNRRAVLRREREQEQIAERARPGVCFKVG